MSKRVPVRTYNDWNGPPLERAPPGYLAIDPVVHSGGPLFESFTHSLVATDVCTGWTKAVPHLRNRLRQPRHVHQQDIVKRRWTDSKAIRWLAKSAADRRRFVRRTARSGETILLAPAPSGVRGRCHQNRRADRAVPPEDDRRVRMATAHPQESPSMTTPSEAVEIH